MKYLLLLAVVAIGVLWLAATRRQLPPSGRRRSRSAKPPAILACVHCGVHLPEDEVVRDGAGRPYCGAVHRDAGPR